MDNIEKITVNCDTNSLSKLDGKELFKLYKETNDKEIRDELVNRYLYIAEILSKKFVNKGIDYEDIYQIASLGLILAIERFDLSKGFEFSSFATPTIIGEIKKYFRDKGWSIRVPRRIQELSRKINNAKIVLTQKLQRTPKVTDIADYLGCTEEQVLEAMDASHLYTLKSLDISYDTSGDDKDLQLKDLIGEDDKSFDQLENSDFLRKNIEKLNQVETKILKLRFFDNKTQSQVAKVLNVSQMTVSRMEKKIIDKFRKELNKMEIS
ncbi:SigB/SigF/SigG family RNA polymerase sigma factor [Crassaminicella indica]|uniref:SigB/SigF/SigG family RNA polymerase sigma factor n=1 Tax=Crassaminicella indica TaxID=2855394 RepID=A0ABX8RD80_9CLOT|nr:SigB/SigF/SigG family RNA polymerase sigma factor [Crassaminicella indica]QXM07033.1 SigB/SigF/SigG family RNA polymerase sigma factor [Crassaminicella indica]